MSTETRDVCVREAVLLCVELGFLKNTMRSVDAKLCVITP